MAVARNVAGSRGRLDHPESHDHASHETSAAPSRVVDTLLDVTPTRIIPFAGASNFRDMGGYRGVGGRVTRWGRLYRSDALHDLTESDVTYFRGLGIVTLVDLRSASEVERTGRGRLADESIRFVNPSVLRHEIEARRRTLDIDDRYLSQRYLQYLDEGGPAFVRALGEMARIENYPMVFNCFFGKDRTGVLAALVLSCLGVTDEAIVDDYALTATRMPLIIDRLRRDTLYRETIERTPARVLDANATTMWQFLRDVDRHFGGARRWALDAGVLPRQLDRLRDALLHDNP